MFRAVNPATEQTVREVPGHDAAETERRVAAAWGAFGAWRDVPAGRRAPCLARAAGILLAARERHARTISQEMGKPVTQALAEIGKCAATLEHYARHGERMLAPDPAPSDAARSYVRYDPLGPLLAVMPWNFPFWQAVRFAAPALAAGNVALVKPAPNVPGCALALEEVFRDAGFPAGTFSLLLISPDSARALVADRRIRGVTLTGSDRAGAAVAAAAGAALKRTVLELGGSDPFVVLADAPVEETAHEAAAARLQNCGQSCIAAKRILVEETVADRFVEALRAAMAAWRTGDPMDPATTLGPLARADLRERLEAQVAASVRAGARVLLGGGRPAGRGWFSPPTLLAGARPGMPVFDEETFGPVAAVTRVRDADEAVALANTSRYGLGASVWTADPARGEALAARLECGAVFVNGIVRSDPRLPFGGIKDSGWGRELGEAGPREFTNPKSVWVR